MISFRKPSEQTIKAFLAKQQSLGFTYPAVGATAGVPPSGYDVDRARIKLGDGERAFLAARAALENWTQFRLGWVEPSPQESSIKVGGVVAVAGRSLGLWSLNACRVIYLVEDDEPVKRFGFAYGTLPGHAETGEERFLVEWDRRDNAVWFDILAFSRPHGFLSHLGNPWLRYLQYRFRQDSMAAMAKGVRKAGG